MPNERNAEGLLSSINDAIALLVDYPGPLQPSDDGLPSLLAQCEALLSEPLTSEPIRTVHHLAATGGTVICRALSAMPNSVLLSEIDPLSLARVNRKKPAFAPTDLILNLRHTLRDVDESLLIECFGASLVALRDGLERRGEFLILRDHAHSHFHTDRNPAERPSLYEIVSRYAATRSLVTLRHPLDSFLSTHVNGWRLHFSPATLEEYSCRSLQFLELYQDLKWFRYEDFVLDPASVLARMCDVLEITYNEDALDLLNVAHLTGDSGRTGNVIAPRPRRAVPAEVVRQAATSDSYARLCERCGYNPDPAAV